MFREHTDEATWTVHREWAFPDNPNIRVRRSKSIVVSWLSNVSLPIKKVALSYRAVKCFSHSEIYVHPSQLQTIKSRHTTKVLIEDPSDTRAYRWDKIYFLGLTCGCSGADSGKIATQFVGLEPVPTSPKPKQDPTAILLRYLDMSSTELEDIFVEILCTISHLSS